MIFNAAINILQQLADTIREIPEEKYKKPITALSQATIGQHVRHTIEFFSCLQQGFNSSEKVVNYDNRQRDFLLETNPSSALNMIRELKSFLSVQPMNVQLRLHGKYGAAKTDFEIPTSYYRELAYNIEHAVHHMALMKVGLKEVAPDMVLPDNFGIASSTMRSRAKQS